MKLYKILVAEKLVRSRTEGERLIRQGAVSVGGCAPGCPFFTTGACTCDGWQKVTNPVEEIEVGLAVKVGTGLWRVMPRIDNRAGVDLVNGIGRSRPERPRDPNQLTKSVIDNASAETEDQTP